jgi:hypothetical protein
VAAPVIYRSTDPGAPALTNILGSLINVLDACLVDGYGGTFATGSILSDSVTPTDGDTITVGSVTYTFRNSISGQPPNAFTIGGSAAQAVVNLQQAINGTGVSGGTTSTGTLANPDVWAGGVVSSVTIPLTARKAGAGGNALALAKSSSHFTVSGSGFLTGGGGAITKSPAGWLRPFAGNSAQAVYKQPAGCGFYLQVDDNGPGSGAGQEARSWGFETMTAYNVGTGQFPLAAQNAAGCVLRKATSAAGAKPWILLVDDRTLYLFVSSGDAVGEYVGHAFGDYYSFNAADSYKCLLMGKNAESGSFLTAHPFGQAFPAQSGTVAGGGQWLARNFSGIGGSTAFQKVGDAALAGASPSHLIGGMIFPNSSDGGLYLAPVRVIDSSPPGVALVSATLNLRGRMRGLWHAPYPIGSFVDGDTFQGSGDLVGRNFLVVRNVWGSTAGAAFVVMETTAWDTSA